MLPQPNQQRTISFRAWRHLFRRWWTPLKWIWGALILSIIINDGSSWLITKSFDISGTPLGWLLAHMEITLPCLLILLLLTDTVFIVKGKRGAFGKSLQVAIVFHFAQERACGESVRQKKKNVKGMTQVLRSITILKLTRFWRVPKCGSLSHEGDRKRKNVRFFFTEDVM
jgi:hypothetical protein